MLLAFTLAPLPLTYHCSIILAAYHCTTLHFQFHLTQLPYSMYIASIPPPFLEYIKTHETWLISLTKGQSDTIENIQIIALWNVSPDQS